MCVNLSSSCTFWGTLQSNEKLQSRFGRSCAQMVERKLRKHAQVGSIRNQPWAQISELSIFASRQFNERPGCILSPQKNFKFSTGTFYWTPHRCVFFWLEFFLTVDGKNNCTLWFCSHFMNFCPIYFIFIGCIAEDGKFFWELRNFDS